MATSQRVLDLLVATVQFLPDDSARIQYIWDVARNPGLHLEPEEFGRCIEKIISSTKSTSLETFCANLRVFWEKNGTKSNNHAAQRLAQGIVLCLSDHLVAKRNFAETTATMSFFDQAIFYCGLLVGTTNSAGSVQKLLRIFGEMAGEGIYIQIEKEYPNLPNQFKTVVAEGVIKKLGARAVLKIYLRVIANTRPVDDNTDQIEDLKEKIRLSCANRSTDSASALDRRNELITLLEKLMGAQEAYDWFSSEFSDMVVPNT